MKYKLPNCIENIGFEIFINGIYEKETSDLIISRIPLNGVYIDVGANIGSIALPVCAGRKDIRTICIEASQRVFEYLKFNFLLNEINSGILINNAVADKDNQVVNFLSPAEQYGKGHLSNTESDLTESVYTITIDTLLKENNIGKVDFIKVDIEGYEYYAFKWAEKLLTGFEPPDILFEFEDWAEERATGINPGDAQQLLLDYGYKLFTVTGKENLMALDKPLQKGSTMILASKKK